MKMAKPQKYVEVEISEELAERIELYKSIEELKDIFADVEIIAR